MAYKNVVDIIRIRHLHIECFIILQVNTQPFIRVYFDWMKVFLF